MNETTEQPEEREGESKNPASSEDQRARVREVPVLEWEGIETPWMRKFLNALAFRPVIAFACRSANVSDKTVTKYREKDPAFGEAVERAMQLGWDAVEEAAHVRAVDGVPKAIFGKMDQVIGWEMKYSDSLAEMLLKGHKPERYRERNQNTTNINIAVGGGFTRLRGSGVPAIGEKLVEAEAVTIEAEDVTRRLR